MDEAITLDKIIAALADSPLFTSLDAAELAEIGGITEVARLNSGQYVYRQGEAADAWYVVFEGRAEVDQRAATGATRTIATLEKGSLFGEIAVLDGSPRPATVLAIEPMSVFRFRRDAFDALLQEGSLAAYKLVAAMARLLSERHRQLTNQIVELLGDDNPVALSVRYEAGGVPASRRLE